MRAIDRYCIYTENLYLEDSIQSGSYVEVSNGIIAGITNTPKADIPVIDLGDYKVLPGFIDLHIHGREGCDVMDAEISSLSVISQSLAKFGVIGFLGTTVTSTWDKSIKAFSTIAKASRMKLGGALVLGSYSEGLFFSASHKGAHNDNFFLELTQQRIDEIYAASEGTLKVLALAPELGKSTELIPYLNSLGVRAMIGHTNANWEQTCCALKTGASGGVHVFNGMSGIHHREPGCAGALLMDESALVEVIADGVHLHPAILKMIYKLKGKKNILLISDCINAGGLNDGIYQLGELDVEVKSGVAKTRQGSLAGSTLTLDKSIKNLVRMAGISEVEAVQMASLVPARFLGLSDSLGSIAPQKRACFAVINKNGHVVCTIIDGEPVFSGDAYIDNQFATPESKHPLTYKNP